MTTILDHTAKKCAHMYAAAMVDAKLTDVDFQTSNGMSLKVWRDAYAEGCLDMAETFYNHLPDHLKSEFKVNIQSAYRAEVSRLEATAMKGDV